MGTEQNSQIYRCRNQPAKGRSAKLNSRLGSQHMRQKHLPTLIAHKTAVWRPLDPGAP